MEMRIFQVYIKYPAKNDLYGVDSPKNVAS